MARKSKYVTDVATFNKEYDRVVRLRKELKNSLDEASRLIAMLEENTDLPYEVEENIAKLKSEASQLSATLSTASSYVSSIETYYNTWSDIKDKIDNELEDAQGHNEDLIKYKESADELSEKLTSELERSSSLLDNAHKTLKMVTDGALSTVFIERSEDRKKSRKLWALAVVLATVIFALAAWTVTFFIAGDIKDTNQISLWVLKIALVSPFAYLLYFVTRQYGMERDLEEKYAFKSLISQTIQNNTKLLKDEFLSEDEVDETIEDKIVDFTIKSLESVYKEPFNNSSLESKMKFSLRKPEAEAEIRQKDKS